jgi:hypothetical protein
LGQASSPTQSRSCPVTTASCSTGDAARQRRSDRDSHRDSLSRRLECHQLRRLVNQSARLSGQSGAATSLKFRQRSARGPRR